VSRTSLFSAGLLVLGLSSLAAACAVESQGEGEVDPEGKTDVSADVAGLKVGYRDLGEIPSSGEARVANYTGSPTFWAYSFNAGGGEDVEAWVRSKTGDAVAWIVDGEGKVLGFGDDASKGTLDARVSITIPESYGPKTKFRLVFREYRRKKATFVTTVRVKPGMFACTTASDCVKVPMAGCCVSWQSIAVNASRVDDYATANACKPPYPPCAPPPDLTDTREPACNAGVCELVEAAAACDPSKEPNRKYVGTSKEMCMLIKFACEPGTEGFANDCGCGCEQPSDCPEWINCMPGPMSTDCSVARARCPYSQIAY
jgi:hypothetical protein